MGTSKREAGIAAPFASLPASLLLLQSRLLHWCVGSLEFFDPRTPVPDRRELAYKSFAELCLAVYLLLRFGGPAAVPAPVAALIGQVCADPAFLGSAFAEPFGILAFVYPALVSRLLHQASGLAGGGTPGSSASDDRLFRFVGNVLASPLLLSAERVPHRIADILFARWLFFERAADLRSLEHAWTISNGVSVPHAAVSSLEDFYALTHNCFYRTGFGLIRNRTRALAQNAPDHHDFAIWRFAAEANRDIAMELVITQLLLRQPATPGTVAVLAQVIGEGETSGFLAGPPSDACGADPAGAWQRHYHTTLVGVILCTLALRPAARPYLASVARVPSSSSLRSLLAAGKILSDLQHRRTTPSDELTCRLDAIRSSPELHGRFERYLDRVPREFRIWSAN